ncbi:MAG: HEAT repeat domain-containing protein [Armatimonadetes bacterium]|nr:HEAT repeat domain-containing protein [Armatimonadota bacterium]
MRGVLVVVFAAFAGFAFGQLTEAEQQGIEDSLMVGGFQLKDLKFERKPFKDPWRQAYVDFTIDDPLSAASDLLRWHSLAQTSGASALLAASIKRGFSDQVRNVPPPAPVSVASGQIPAPVAAIVGRLVGAMVVSDSEIRAALAKLDAKEQRELIEGLPVWAVEEPKVKFSFVKGETARQARLLELLAKVDLARIRAASVVLTAAVEKAVTELKAAKAEMSGKVRLQVAGLPVVVAGTGNDVHDETDARLTVDLGGDDTYKGRHGAGVGYSSVLIDLGGDDHYEVKDLSVGAAELGIGIAFDCGGRDTFRGQSLCFGAGLAGVGVFEKVGGDDDYSATALAEGFGQFGIGLCLDTGGNDRYGVKLFGQGAARTQGVGWLVDRAGNDEYRAGGLSMNEPLFTGVSYSFAQGYGSGYRDDTGGLSGGIGLLTDIAGDDFYLGDTYMQAASYWFATGSLCDFAGNDTYSGYHYCQASAMHCCSAYLFDLAGNDAYVTKFGASLAIGHDYGVAFLLDRLGDDIYAARDSTPGVGNANGLGIFVDGDGIDRYDGPPGQGNGARGTGSLGVFVDLNGPDKYRSGLADGEASSSSNWGTAYDAESKAAASQAAQPHVSPKPGTAKLLPDAEMEALYKKATQWGVGSAQQEVLEGTDQLVAIGVPALEWMLNKHLATADRLQQRAFVAVVQALGPDGAIALGPKALKGTKEEKRVLLGIALDAGVKDFGAVLAPMLEDPDLRLAAAKAAGPLKALACLNGLQQLCLDQDRLLVRAAMVSLAELGDVGAAATAQALLTSSDLPTKRAALQLLGMFPGQAKIAAEPLINDLDDGKAVTGLALLGKVATPDALKTIGGFLSDPRPIVRIEAMRQLSGRCPAEFLAGFKALSTDAVPVVRAAAKGFKP